MSPGNAQQIDSFEQVELLRLAGSLDLAQEMAEKLLVREQTPFQQLQLHLELARIHDRFGLHRNSRPVAESLRHIELAVGMADANHRPSQARLELARADSFYRAEMSEREFPLAGQHARRAMELFGNLGDKHGEAEAVHRLGLIEMQRRNLDLARTLFERSLEIDREAGERTFFRGEYERHVGFVLLFEDDTENAIPFLERSLAFRRDAGAIDASLFAATTLASAYVDTGRLAEAKPVLLYAMMIGEKIDSPIGLARAGLTLGRLHIAEGDQLAARIAFEMTIKIAASVDHTSLVELASDELSGL